MQIRVLIVDDSVLMRNMIQKCLESDPTFQVVGKARNGMEAVQQVRLLKPDVITMDVEMPAMNGLDALKVIMKEHPTPTIMLSLLTRTGASDSVEALRIGAFDIIGKPSGFAMLDLPRIQEELMTKIKAAAQTTTAIRIH